MSDRTAPLAMTGAEFRAAGHALVDRVAAFLDSIPSRRVTPGEPPAAVRALLGDDRLPERGAAAASLLEDAAGLVLEHSLLNGHPRFFGYITSSAAPIGALGDLLAAAVNPNVGAWALSPIATEIEAQTIRWIADLTGFPRDGGGLLVSGGNMANMVAFAAARTAKATWDVRKAGLASGTQHLVAYASAETHTWLQKAADLFGLGTDAVRWIEVDAELRMRVDALDDAVRRDRAAGLLPFLAVGTAGSVSTGAVDPLPRIAEVCRRHGLWFHVDGAYGAAAAGLPEASADLRGLRDADSIALDPHKWLYAPLEAGCTLVRRRADLAAAFAYHPAYYGFGSDAAEPPINYYELGPQNSRGFRALKVWLGLRQAGREGCLRMIRDDIALAARLDAAVRRHPELEAGTLGLSIATFRFVPPDLDRSKPGADEYVNALNRELLAELQAGGEAFLSNAVVEGKHLVRACIVNFRTGPADVEALPEIVARVGRDVDRRRRPAFGPAQTRG